MTRKTPDLKTINTIAYDKPLRDYLKQLHDMLGEGVTDIASNAMEFAYKYRTDASDYLKLMSQLTSELSIVLIQAKGDKKLDEEEQRHFDAIKGLAETLGNLQFKINKIIEDLRKLDKLADKVSEEGAELANSVIDAQAEFRAVRSDINDLNVFSRNPRLANLFREQTEAKQAKGKKRKPKFNL